MTKVTNIEKHIIKRVNVGNVTQVTSANPWLPSLSFSETFTYDASDQLFPLLFLCSPKEKKQKEKAFAAGEKNPVHYARQLAERRNPLRSHRSTPLPCYGKRIFSVTPQVAFTVLQPTGNPDDIFYYHTNHLGSTAFVTDQNQNITQGFLYAPFGEITTEYAPLWQNATLPKYAFNAKELDEETGMYYYEARYYKPPVFTSRDPMFEKYFWMTPYAYCANNPVKYVDPDGREKVKSLNTNTKSDDENKKNTHILEAADNYPENKGVIHLWAHGNPEGTGVIIWNGQRDILVTDATKLSQFLRNNSDIWSKNTILYKKTSILVMHTCNAGKGDNSLAKNLSMELDAVIVAPSKTVQVDIDKDNIYKEIGVAQGGCWKVFYKGVLVDTFNGKTKPIFSDPEMIIKKYLEKYNELINENNPE